MEEPGSTSARRTRGHELRAVALVSHLRRRGPTSRAALAEEMGTSPKTLRNTIELLERGAVIAKHGDRVWLHPELGVLVGVDLTHERAAVAVSRFDFELLNDPADRAAQSEVALDDPSTALDQVARLIVDALEEHVGAERVSEALIGVGVTLPGPVRRERNPRPSRHKAAVWNRRVQAGPILPGWDDVDVGAELANLLKQRYGIEPHRHAVRRFVWVENDASAGALGVHTELRTSLADDAPDDLVYLRMATGIGAGIINKGHLVTGARGFAGELGHVRVAPGGALCPACGGRGCLETLASNRVIVEQVESVLRQRQILRTDAAEAGVEVGRESLAQRLERLLSDPHPAVDRALWDAGSHTGSLVATVCSALNPSWIVFGGLIAEYRSKLPPPFASESVGNRPFLAAVEQSLRLNAMSQASERVELRSWGELSSHDQAVTPELLGALALVVDHLGDAYLLDPIERWIREPESRQHPLRFV